MLDETSYRYKLALNLKRKHGAKGNEKALVAFMILELFEDTNDGVKRGKTRECLRARTEKGMFQTVLHRHLRS